MTTHPGMNKTFALDQFPLGERRIILRLSTHFYITRAARSVQIGNSDYRSFLMRPSEEISTALNVEREIMVLFADYETFEARTLQAFDLTSDQFDDVRVDRSLRFLIARDRNIETIIRHFLFQDPEYPIVIPFNYADFDLPNDNFIFDKIRRNYLIRDLFGYQSPLKQEYFFFGRNKLVNDVIDLHKSGQNSGLFGLRKSGKTSTIYAIQRRAKVAGCRTMLLDCQDPAIHAKRFGALLQYIVSNIRKELSLREIKIDLGETADQISERFRQHMNMALSEGHTDILLLFDEIENISPKTAASRHWRDTTDALLFWQIMRSFFQSPRKYKLTFCFVGTNPHLFEMPTIQGIDNPIYLFAPKTFIPMLTLDETEEMIDRLGYFMGLDFDPTVIAYIHNRFGGHPFFIRQLCSKIHRTMSTNRPRAVSVVACKNAEQSGSADIYGYLDEIMTKLRSFYPEEYDMLEYLARGEINTFGELAKYSLSYVEHLIGYGIVIRRGNDFEFAFDAIAEAVKKNLSDTGSNTLEDKRREISKRRNALEEEVRTSLYHWAKQLSHDKWQKSVEECVTKARRDSLGVLNIREAFSRNRSPLNFIELLRFVQHSGEFSESEGGDMSVSSAMDFVNKHRIDAHAKDIAEDDYAQLIRSFELLESVFLPPP